MTLLIFSSSAWACVRVGRGGWHARRRAGGWRAPRLGAQAGADRAAITHPAGAHACAAHLGLHGAQLGLAQCAVLVDLLLGLGLRLAHLELALCGCEMSGGRWGRGVRWRPLGAPQRAPAARARARAHDPLSGGGRGVGEGVQHSPSRAADTMPWASASAALSAATSLWPFRDAMEGERVFPFWSRAGHCRHATSVSRR